MIEQSLIYRDPLGFPMIWIDDVGAYMHWLPITKIQFEHFLSDAPDRSFDAAWHQKVLGLNPRVTAANVNSGNYWRTLMTGVLPEEALRFARWSGDGYHLPTARQWSSCYAALYRQPALDIKQQGILMGDGSRSDHLIEQLDLVTRISTRHVGYHRLLVDQMLLRLGAVEWVTLEDHLASWGGMGEPHPSFCGNLSLAASGVPMIPFEASAHRIYCFGFRLLFFPDQDAPNPDRQEESSASTGAADYSQNGVGS